MTEREADAVGRFPRPGTVFAIGILSLVVFAILSFAGAPADKSGAFIVLGAGFFLLAGLGIVVERYWLRGDSSD